jgi:nucleoside-diphosphate-sugar epimerase
MDRILITGATGFVGRHCVALLRQLPGEVHAVGRSLAADGPCFHAADLLDASQVSALMAKVRPTHLLHLAWIVTPGSYRSAPENMTWAEAGTHLLRSFCEHGGKRALMVGSCAEYDWSNGVCREGVTPLQPSTAYGAGKLRLRQATERIAESAGVSWAWARLFFLYGPHEHPQRLVPYLVRSLLAGLPATCSNGGHERDYLHVFDAAVALVALLRGDFRGDVNVASGSMVALAELAERVAQAVGRPELLRRGPRTVAADEPRRLAADVRRLRDEVGWSPRVELEQGLADAVAWWRAKIRTEARAA